MQTNVAEAKPGSVCVWLCLLCATRCACRWPGVRNHSSRVKEPHLHSWELHTCDLVHVQEGLGRDTRREHVQVGNSNTKPREVRCVPLGEDVQRSL